MSAVEEFNENQREAIRTGRTPKGLRCVHAQGCRVFACCDMLDDCMDAPFPGKPKEPPHDDDNA